MRAAQQKPSMSVSPVPSKPAPAAAAADDDDDDLMCSMCMSSFWYKGELTAHMKSAHNVGGGSSPEPPAAAAVAASEMVAPKTSPKA